jgi:hypothetical protein
MVSNNEYVTYTARIRREDEGTSSLGSGGDRDVTIRDLLDPVSIILPVFIRRWENKMLLTQTSFRKVAYGWTLELDRNRTLGIPSKL